MMMWRWRRRRKPASRLSRQIALGLLEDAMGRVQGSGEAGEGAGGAADRGDEEQPGGKGEAGGAEGEHTRRAS